MTKHRFNAAALALAAATTAATFAGADALARHPSIAAEYVVLARAPAASPHGPVPSQVRHARI